MAIKDIIGPSSTPEGLPEPGSEWPPVNWETEYRKFREWAAWYSGDPTRLSDVYSDLVSSPDIQGRLWSKEIEEDIRTMLHVPAAGDIASVNADLLVGSSPNFKIPGAHGDGGPGTEETQDRLNYIIQNSELFGRLVKAAETAAAIGGCYLKADWDKELKDTPIVSVVQQDNTLPQFRYSFLDKVLFHQVVSDFDDTEYWWRHIEYREPGIIRHGLYRGTKQNLGRKVPLTEHPSTEYLEPEINHGLDDLLVRYVPNKKPNRLWRTSSLGQSDYQGIEGIMDSLDATYTSWIRDLKLAKARILVPRNFLKNEAGELIFDPEKSVYLPLNTGPGGDKKITMQQFDIRSAKHKETAMELFMRIVDSAGYSPQTFGMKTSGRAESGTALRTRERKSVQTKAKKERFFEKPVTGILEALQKIDNQFLNQNYEIARPRIEFEEAFKPSMATRADTLTKLENAQAASIETKVRYRNPDLSESEIEEEVERIKDEKGMNVESPNLRA